MAEHRAECDARVRLARVRVAELEQRVKRAEAEGDAMTARMTLAELQKEEAECARDAAEMKLRALSNDDPSQDVQVASLKSELEKMQTSSAALKDAFQIAMNQTAEKMRGVVEKLSSEIAGTHQKELADILEMHRDMTSRVLAEETLISRNEDLKKDPTPAGGASNPSEYPAEPEWIPPKTKKKKSRKPKKATPFYGSLTSQSIETLQRKGSSSSSTDSSDGSYDEQLTQGIITRLRNTETSDEARLVAEKALEIVKDLSSVPSFAVAVCQEGAGMKDYQRYAIGKLVGACGLSLLLSIEALMEVLSVASQDSRVKEKHIAEYASVMVEVDALKIRHVCKAVERSMGLDKMTDIVIQLADKLRDNVGEKSAIAILNGPGGLREEQRRAIQWLYREDTDYCPDSRSTSDTE